MSKDRKNNEAMKDVQSLRVAIRLRFVVAFLEWISPRKGNRKHGQGDLAQAFANATGADLDTLS